MPVDWIIAGLGNPGKKYEATRHNVGFMLVDALSHANSAWRSRWEAESCEAAFGEHRALLAKPMTFMNNSGRSLAPMLKSSGLKEIGKLVVVHDEIDLPFGRVRVKNGGGHGGHNGLRSIIDHLGNSGFSRIRIGVGRGNDVTNYVLSPFNSEEREALPAVLERAAKATEAILREGVVAAQNQFNSLN